MDKVDQTALTPANANPWYVLMTLYGEQTGEEVDEALHERNRTAWNAWACQGMSQDERAKVAKSPFLMAAELNSFAAELAAWPQMQNEVILLHEAEMLRRNGEGFAYPGLPLVADEVSLRRVAFAQNFVMKGAVFAKNASFESSTFTKGAQFASVTFVGNALFESVKFGDFAWFSLTAFHNDALFTSARFDRFVGFYCAMFGGKARFDSTNFARNAWFNSSVFRGDAVFSYSEFNGLTSFANATFGLEGHVHTADFTDTPFMKPTNFRDATFHSRYPDFSGAILHDKTIFTDHPDHWPKGVQADLVQAKASCAVIRHSLGKQGLPEAEHFFYRREMAFGKEIGGFWERFPFRLYDWFSGYGYSIGRPAVGLVWLWLVPGFAFFMRGATGVPLADVGTLFRSLGLSFANMFSFLGLQKTFFAGDLEKMQGAFQTLAGVQTVMGFVLLFFLGLGLRNRFRLK